MKFEVEGKKTSRKTKDVENGGGRYDDSKHHKKMAVDRQWRRRLISRPTPA